MEGLKMKYNYKDRNYIRKRKGDIFKYLGGHNLFNVSIHIFFINIDL